MFDLEETGWPLKSTAAQNLAKGSWQSNRMELGMFGLGKMEANMSRSLLQEERYAVKIWIPYATNLAAMPLGKTEPETKFCRSGQTRGMHIQRSYQSVGDTRRTLA
jgi:hypothetical protein